MADPGSGDKSEKASQQKLKKARDNGQVVRSRDIATAVGIFIALKLLVVLAPSWLTDFRRLFVLGFTDLHGSDALGNRTSVLIPASLLLFAKMALPLAAVPVCVVIGSLFPGGWLVSGKNLMPKFSRMNPITNLGKLVSAKHYGQFAVQMAKAFALIAVLWHLSQSALRDFLRLQTMSMPEAIAGGANLLMDGAMALAMVMIVFALIDVPVQQFIFMRGQRMTKQEVKDEYKNTEGKPEVKGRIRQLQRQAATRSLQKSVPQADVVIMNPTHYAVALKYDADRAEAPFVVAKGVDDMAFAIRRLAEENGIEVLTLPPLARAIYNTSQVNQQIPAALYRAVAQVLTYVMQLRAFQAGRTQGAPDKPTHVEVPESLSEGLSS